MRVLQIIISATTTFFIVGGGSFGAVMVALAGEPLKPSAIIVVVITGLVASMKDIRATMSLPPLSNGNYQALGDLIRETRKKEKDTSGNPS